MKKRGFTLIEVLGVIIILGIILTISVPVVNTVITNSRKSAYSSVLKNIENAARNWATDYAAFLPDNNGESITITLGQLVQENYIDKEIKNPITGEVISYDTLITITKRSELYVFDIGVVDGDNEEIVGDKPTITLNGTARMEHNINTPWVDPGIIVWKNGVSSTTDYTEEIYQVDGDEQYKVSAIDVTNFNTYKIVYSTSNIYGTTSVTREVVIVDKLPPIITVDGHTSDYRITHEAGILNIPEAIVTDNSLEVIDAVVSSNVNPLLVGTYAITYTATDSHENTATLVLTVNVVDTVDPVITINPTSVQIAQGESYDLMTGVSATDISGIKSITYTSSPTYSNNTAGTYTITYTATDNNGRTNTGTRTIIVADKIPPVIVFNPTATDTWSKTDINVNISASDNIGILSFKYCLTNSATCTPNTDANINGTNIMLGEGKNVICAEAIDNAITPNITNKCSNQYLIDKTPPTLTVTGCPTSGECTIETGRGISFTLPSYTVSDNLSEVSVVTNGNVNTSIKDTYNVTYKATDEAGNSTSKIIKIIVRDPNIGEIASQLLANNTTYNYMDGTYLNGAISNNYVWYNGFIWRIMGKNADGSIRLVTEEDVTSIPWGADNAAQDYGNSYIKDWVNNYFLSRLKDTSKIVSTSFCEDSTLVTDSSSARTTCSNSVQARAGILSYDEYNLAGGSSGYLKNGQTYWALTPYSASNGWTVHGEVGANSTSVASAYGVRAVISISSDTTITGGNGTLTANSDTEYVLGQTLANVTGTLSSKARSGEYVKFDGRLYRIVEHTGSGTKLILDGFYDTNTAYGTDFADMSTLLTSSSFLNWLAPTRQADILDTTWYRGDYWTGGDYKTNLASTANPFTNKAGLIRVGEMLASQSLSLISSNYSKTNSYSNTKNYCMLTPSSASEAWHVHILSGAYKYSVRNAFGVRPVIMVDSELEIESGNGLLSNPYELKSPIRIGEIVDQLLANNSKYTYMDGTYLKGSIKNNYVWYNGFIWRIMGKNADGSIRLVTEEAVTSISWGAYSKNYGDSYIKDWVNNYFLSRLKDTSKIVSTNFCEDSTYVTDKTSSRTTCSNPVSAKVGLLSLDEYNLAGGSSGYLKTTQYYWFLTKYNEYYAWSINNLGNVVSNYNVSSNVIGVKAVVSISSDTIITAGKGTLTANSDTEYVAGQTLDNVTGTLGSKAGSGEYVKFDGRLYRIVEHTGSGTKLILDGFYDTATAYGSNFSTMSALLTSSSFLNWLAPTRQADILNTTWYRGDYWTVGDYKTNLSSTSNSFTNKVGLIRLGEMLASNTKTYWTLTPYDASKAWYMGSTGVAYSYDVTYTDIYVRPVIMISSSKNITKGNGTLSSPYEV